MELLGRYSGRVLTHKFIIDQIWGPNNTDSQSLRVFMASLRRKIEIDTTQPIYLLTEVGVGYRLADEQ
jgi:two-component system KDP operon response regulator KdpE